MSVQLAHEARKAGGPSAARLKATAGRLLELVGLPDAEWSLSIIDDDAMEALNRKWRGKESTTDVLSFPQLDDEELEAAYASDGAGALIGDVVISLPTAKRQAKEFGHSLSDEIDRLLAHGLLHLLGYDHERGPNDARSQRLREYHLLRKLRG